MSSTTESRSSRERRVSDSRSVIRLVHLAGVVDHCVEEPPAFVVELDGMLVEDHARQPADGTQRGAQIMGYGMGERFQFLVDGLQPGGALGDALLQFLVHPHVSLLLLS